MLNTELVLKATLDYFGSDVRRINHLLKVYGFAKTIGVAENLPPFEAEVLEVAAILHDIGIKNSEQKHGSSAGHYQQIEGPPVARDILSNLSFPEKLIDRVCYLIAHHHTYTDIDGLDYLILVEADFLVNIYEDQMSHDNIRSVKEKIFRTESGTALLTALYL